MIQLATGDGPPPGRYTIMPGETFRRLIAELMANPDVFAAVGELRTWEMTVRDHSQRTEGSR